MAKEETRGGEGGESTGTDWSTGGVGDSTGSTDGTGALAQLSFREASEELEGIVRLLEGNQLELEESLERYERGVALLRTLQTRLAEAQQKVTVLLGEVEPESDDSIDTTLS
jgi:exodeoxyribonuclease VII small subunit